MAIVLELLRHGQALPASPGGDRERPLSAGGEQVVAQLAAHLAGTGWQPDRAFTSPLRRAVDTARIVCGAAGAPVRIETMRELEPDARPADVLEALAREGATRGQVLLVGHMPLLGSLAAYLTGAENGLAPGALLRIQCSNGPGRAAGEVTLSLRPADL